MDLAEQAEASITLIHLNFHVARIFQGQELISRPSRVPIYKIASQIGRRQKLIEWVVTRILP